MPNDRTFTVTLTIMQSGDHEAPFDPKQVAQEVMSHLTYEAATFGIIYVGARCTSDDKEQEPYGLTWRP